VGSGDERHGGSPAVEVLRRVHAQPKVTRAEVAREVGLSTGTATEVVARLRQQNLLQELPAPPTGARGRPTTCLCPHPAGPLVLAAEIEHDGWVVALVEVGGRVTQISRGRHRSHRPEAVLRSLGARIQSSIDVQGSRIRAVGLSVAGAVQDERIAQLHTLGWRDVDVRAAMQEAAVGLPVSVGNDASLGAVAEARRGAGTDATTLLHVRVAAGVGGGVVDHGRPFLGATGAAGEFGHLPFGDAKRACGCGARGCWGPEVDGTAFARMLGDPVPPDPTRYGLEVVAAARLGDAAAVAAVGQVAQALGRGLGGLVNALDPDVVTIDGHGVDVLDLAGPAVHKAYVSGLMEFRRGSPPPIRPSVVGVDGPLVGAAEIAFDSFLTDAGLDEWNRLQR
jgi:predicted NBD/HSP70 family sugar kinase